MLPSCPHEKLFWRHLELRGSELHKDFLKEASMAWFCGVTGSRKEIMARLLQPKLSHKDTGLLSKCITLETFFNSEKARDYCFVPRGFSFCTGATSVFEQCWRRGCTRLDDLQGPFHATVICREKQWWTNTRIIISIPSHLILQILHVLAFSRNILPSLAWHSITMQRK